MGVAWSPDGRRIAAPLVVDGTCGIFVAGVGAMEKTLRKISARCDQVFDWSPDGRFVAVTNGFRQDGFAFLAVDRAQESFERTLKASSMQGWLRFSPDGTSVAFDAAPVQTDIRRGKAPAGYHVYLAAFAAGGDAGAVEPMSISLAGGSRPAWRRDGMELFFLDGERRLMSFRNNPGGDPLTVLFAMDRADLAFSEYDVTPDGRLFVVNREIDRGILFVPRMNAR
jgi:dipeptidyl aminopeptidase/acylaminoacyl peptidase